MQNSAMAAIFLAKNLYFNLSKKVLQNPSVSLHSSPTFKVSTICFSSSSIHDDGRKLADRPKESFSDQVDRASYEAIKDEVKSDTMYDRTKATAEADSVDTEADKKAEEYADKVTDTVKDVAGSLVDTVKYAVEDVKGATKEITQKVKEKVVTSSDEEENVVYVVDPVTDDVVPIVVVEPVTEKPVDPVTGEIIDDTSLSSEEEEIHGEETEDKKKKY